MWENHYRMRSVSSVPGYLATGKVSFIDTAEQDRVKRTHPFLIADVEEPAALGSCGIASDLSLAYIYGLCCTPMVVTL